MRVLQIHNRYRERGGEDSAVEAEAALLRGAGHEVVEFRADNPAASLAAARSFALAPWNPLARRRVRAAAAAGRPDVAHVHNTWFDLSPSVLGALREAGVPVVMTMHNYRAVCANGLLFRDGRPCEDCVGTHPWAAVRHRCYRGSMLASGVAAATIAYNGRRGTWRQDADLFLTPSEFARQRLIAGGLPADRVVTKPHFVADPGPRALPARESNTVLFVGRLSPEKGLDVLLEAWAMNPPAGLELALVGDGPLRSELAGKLPADVRLCGSATPDEVSRMMLAARALVFPSQWYETFGLVLVEAMAAGLPLVVSDLGAGPEIAGHAGLRVPPSDARGWAAALAQLENDELIGKLSAASRSRYVRDYTPQVGLAALLRAYGIAQRQQPADMLAGP